MPLLLLPVRLIDLVRSSAHESIEPHCFRAKAITGVHSVLPHLLKLIANYMSSAAHSRAWREAWVEMLRPATNGLQGGNFVPSMLHVNWFVSLASCFDRYVLLRIHDHLTRKATTLVTNKFLGT